MYSVCVCVLAWIIDDPSVAINSVPRIQFLSERDFLRASKLRRFYRGNNIYNADLVNENEFLSSLGRKILTRAAENYKYFRSAIKVKL